MKQLKDACRFRYVEIKFSRLAGIYESDLQDLTLPTFAEVQFNSHLFKRKTMTEKLIISQLHQLPENLKVEVLHYIEFLKDKYSNEHIDKPRKRTFGSAKGEYELASDFNAPLDDFNDYM